VARPLYRQAATDQPKFASTLRNEIAVVRVSGIIGWWRGNFSFAALAKKGLSRALIDRAALGTVSASLSFKK
jgi:hypothetical protein